MLSPFAAGKGLVLLAFGMMGWYISMAVGSPSMRQGLFESERSHDSGFQVLMACNERRTIWASSQYLACTVFCASDICMAPGAIKLSALFLSRTFRLLS
jgi:hypothetical protein